MNRFLVRSHNSSKRALRQQALCYRHHWMVHEGEWQIVRADDGRMLTIPPMTPYQRLARGPD